MNETLIKESSITQNEIKEKKVIMTEKEFDDFNNKLLQQAIDGINEATYRERSRTLSEFSTEALETELSRRKNGKEK